MSFYYVLEWKEPKAIEDAVEWSRWFSENIEERRVGETTVGETWVSTVFLGVDHSGGGDPPAV